MVKMGTVGEFLLWKAVHALGAIAILQIIAKHLRVKKAIQGPKNHVASHGSTSVTSRIGQVLGDLLPTTKKNRKALLEFHLEDPPFTSIEVAEIAAGKLRGFRKEESGSLIFRGVPFASARRLEVPGPVEPWKGERSCLRFGPACPQPTFGPGRLGMGEGESVGAALIEHFFPPLPADESYWYGTMAEETCLNANVYTPSLDGKLPVLVFIHGGGFQGGSNVEGGFYEGSQLSSAQDIVVVTINYRLGPFGFLHFPEHGITNLGIRDQIAGLEWVRDNIAKFGGDPSNVTISGESAGGMSVGTLIGSPRARGLFHRAVPMSGATFHSSSEQPWQHLFQVIEADLVQDTGGRLTPETFKKIPAHKLVAYMNRIGVKFPALKLGSRAMTWQPYQDGDVVPKGGAHAGLAGAPPILTGVMDNEWRFFTNLYGFGPVNTKREAIKDAVESLRSYFHRTNKDDKVGDAVKWKNHAESLYDLLSSCRSKRGLPVDPPNMYEALQNLFLFEDANFCLARDAGAFAYNLHFWDDAHARDILLLFGFQGNATQGLTALDHQPLSQDDHNRSSQFQHLIGSFMRCGKPSVDGLEWKPQSEIMGVKAHPEVQQFKEELIKFQDLKRTVAADLAIDAILPQNLAA